MDMKPLTHETMIDYSNTDDEILTFQRTARIRAALGNNVSSIVSCLVWYNRVLYILLSISVETGDLL